MSEEQRLNDLASARWIGLAVQYLKSVEILRVEQRLNDASARWAGLTDLYQLAVVTEQLEVQRLNDLASARWTGLAAQYQVRAMSK